MNGPLDELEDCNYNEHGILFGTDDWYDYVYCFKPH